MPVTGMLSTRTVGQKTLFGSLLRSTFLNALLSAVCVKSQVDWLVLSRVQVKHQAMGLQSLEDPNGKSSNSSLIKGEASYI